MPTIARPRRMRRLALAGLLVLAPLALTTASSALSVDLLPVNTNPDINEKLPSASGDWIAWTATSEARPRHPNAFVQQAGHSRVRLNALGTYGESGGFNGNTFLYTQWSDEADADIWRVNLNTWNRSRFPRTVNTGHAEFQSTMSGKWLLFTRYRWDDKRYRIVLFNRETGSTRNIAVSSTSGYAVSGQVNGRYATYYRSFSDKSVVFRYDIATRTTVRLPNPTRYSYSPGLADDGTVFFVRSGRECGADADLVRYPVGGPVEEIRDLADRIDIWWVYVDDRTDGSREVHVGQADCDQQGSRMLDTYKFVDSYTLTVAMAGDGTGIVTSDPAGIDCGSDCTEVLARGTTVTLTAVPGPDSVVTGWSVEACGTESQCVVDVTANQTVTVSFGPMT